MEYPVPLIPARLLRRYKRFLADVELPDGRMVVAHCPNPGGMLGCMGEGWPVRLAPAAGAGRKLAYTLELVHDGAGWIGVNTHRANALAAEAIAAGWIPELSGYAGLRREVPYAGDSRVDLLLERPGERCYVEVKSVTWAAPARPGEPARYLFPDAVTARGLKHLRALEAARRDGHRAVLLFAVQRGGAAAFSAARKVDPAYAEGLDRARARGVEVLVYRANLDPSGSRLDGGRVPWLPWETPLGDLPGADGAEPGSAVPGPRPGP